MNGIEAAAVSRRYSLATSDRARELVAPSCRSNCGHGRVPVQAQLSGVEGMMFLGNYILQTFFPPLRTAFRQSTSVYDGYGTS
jgi:hypothetical protein